MEYKCSKCGSVFNEKHKFCPECGTKVTYEEVKKEESAPVKEEIKSEPIIPEVVQEAAKEEKTKPEPKPIPRKVIHILNLVSSSICILFAILVLLLPIFYTYISRDDVTYPIAFGFIDFYVYKIVNLFKGSFGFMALGFNMAAYLTGLFCGVVILNAVSEIIKGAKGLKKNAKPELPNGKNQVRRSMLPQFVDSQTANAFLCLVFPIVLVIESKVFGNYVGLLFQDFNLFAFIPVASILIPLLAIMITRLILIKKVK